MSEQRKYLGVLYARWNGRHMPMRAYVTVSETQVYNISPEVEVLDTSLFSVDDPRSFDQNYHTTHEDFAHDGTELGPPSYPAEGCGLDNPDFRKLDHTDIPLRVSLGGLALAVLALVSVPQNGELHEDAREADAHGRIMDAIAESMRAPARSDCDRREFALAHRDRCAQIVSTVTGRADAAEVRRAMRAPFKPQEIPQPTFLRAANGETSSSAAADSETIETVAINVAPLEEAAQIEIETVEPAGGPLVLSPITGNQAGEEPDQGSAEVQ